MVDLARFELRLGVLEPDGRVAVVNVQRTLKHGTRAVVRVEKGGGG